MSLEDDRHLGSRDGSYVHAGAGVARTWPVSTYFESGVNESTSSMNSTLPDAFWMYVAGSGAPSYVETDQVPTADALPGVV